MIKKGIWCCLLCCLLLPIQSVYGSNSTYRVVALDEQAGATLVDEVTSWKDARSIYEANEDAYDNLYIERDERIYQVKYGYIAFDKSDQCDINIEYSQGDSNGYTNGCYGADAAYLSTSEDGKQVSFLLSGAYGKVDINDVEIFLMDTTTHLSSYHVKEKKLYHQIKTDIRHKLYSSDIYLGEAPEYLQEDMTYYSYDGHYFYQGDTLLGYTTMIDDLRSETFAHAFNAETPYYNYYQYVPHRSKTSYTEEQINAYFDNTLHIQSPLTTYTSIGTSYHGILTQSMLKSQANAFLQYQDQFGANALMMLSLSMNESAIGRSYLAYTRNNVFGHAAFDSAVEENAARYASISSSIYSHAKHYISNSYSNPERFQYHGSFFGSKASGMNVSYASDPYWGEKAAQYYARLDDALGGKDKNSYALGILSKDKEVSIYREATRTSDVLYTNESLQNFVVILLEKKGNWYKIQSDPAYSEQGNYIFSQDIAYVSQEDIDMVLHEEKMKETKTFDITFDANGGKFLGDETSITLQIEKARFPSITPPEKDNAIFVSWDKKIESVNKNEQYIAQYKTLKQAEVTNLKKTVYTSDEQLDVSGATLTLTYQDNEVEEIPLNASMVSNFDPEKIGEVELKVTYQGISANVAIIINPVKEAQTELMTRIRSMLDEIDNINEISDEQKQELLTLKQEIDQHTGIDLSYGDYRKLDSFIQAAYGSSLQTIVSGNMQAQVSGLSLATKITTPSLLPTVLKFNATTGISKESQTLLQNTAQGNEYTPVFYFELSGKKDLSALKLQDDVIVALKKPDNTEINMQYFIMQCKDNNVYQIPTSQSNNYITFATDSFGEFALVSRNTTNIYGDNDQSENNSEENNGYDIFTYLLTSTILILCIIILIITLNLHRKRNPRMTKILQKNELSKSKHKNHL